jgi:predicted GH43/DUF377 family glycosyl hydrolase
VHVVTAGQVRNVVFVEALARDGGRWLAYDGAADKGIGVAAFELESGRDASRNRRDVVAASLP